VRKVQRSVLDPIYSQRSLFLNALLQVVDMLAKTRAELNDFHQSSKELEAELQNELQRTERAQRELQAKVIRAENERDKWKVHVAPESTPCQFTYLTLFFRISSCPFKQRTILPRLPFNANSIRQEYQKTKENILELEMENDDLDRNERWLIWSTGGKDFAGTRTLRESRFGGGRSALEGRASRYLPFCANGIVSNYYSLTIPDANVEISILKDQLAPVHSRQTSKSKSESLYNGPSTENLLKTAPPPDLDLGDDLSPSSEEMLPYPDKTITTPKASMSRPAVPVSFMTQTVIAEKPTPPMPLKTTTNIICSTSQPLMPSPICS